MKKRILSLLLAIIMVISLLPLQAIAVEINGHPTAGKDLTITKQDGSTTVYDPESWEDVYPYGAFLFGHFQADVFEDPTQGDQTIEIPVYRLGGTKGRATVWIDYMPAISEVSPGEITEAYGASGITDVLIEAETRSPGVENTPLGAFKIKASELSLSFGDAKSDKSGGTITPVTITNKKSEIPFVRYQWQVGYFKESSKELFWEDIAGETKETLPLPQDFPYDRVRCIVRDATGNAYCTLDNEGGVYKEESVPALESEIPDTNGDGYYAIPFEKKYGEYGGSRFSLTYNEGEWVKYIRVTALDDDISELDKLGTFHLSSNLGGELPDTAPTLTLQVHDNDVPDKSQIGFALSDAEFDQAEGKARIAVRRTGDLSYVTSVSYHTEDGTALAGKQYAETSGKLLFAGDIDEAYIEVPLLGEEKRDEQLDFTLVLDEILGGGKDTPCTLDKNASSLSVALYSTGTSSGDEAGLNLGTVLMSETDDTSSNITASKKSIISLDNEITGEQVDTEEIAPLEATYSSDSASLFSYDYPADENIKFRRSDYPNYDNGVEYWDNLEDCLGTDYRRFEHDVVSQMGYGKPENWSEAYFRQDIYNTYATQLSEGPRIGFNSYSTRPSELVIDKGGLLFSDVHAAWKWNSIGHSWHGTLIHYTYCYLHPWAHIRGPISGGDIFWNGGLERWNSDPGADVSSQLLNQKSGESYQYRRIDMKDEPIRSQLELSYASCWNTNEPNKVLIDKNVDYQYLYDDDKIYTEYQMSQFRMTRRFFDKNELGLKIYTANDANLPTDNLLGVNFSVLSPSDYRSIRPTISIVPHLGGITEGGQLYVGSKIQVELKSSDVYKPYEHNTPGTTVFVTNSKGKILPCPITRQEGTNIYNIDFIWDGMTPEDLKETYTINVRMDRYQTLILDYSNSIPRKEGSSDPDISRYEEALNSIKSHKVYTYYSSFNYYIENYKEAEFYSRHKNLTPYGDGAFTLTNNNTALKMIEPCENLHEIEFDFDPEDVILLEGRAYKGNEKIPILPKDLSSPVIRLQYISKEYLSVPTTMVANVDSVGLYYDANGNGRIDGYTNENGFFLLNKESGDEIITYLNGTYDETLFQPYLDKDGKLHQCFLKVLYSTNPRCMEPDAGGKADDTAMILPAFTTSVTDKEVYQQLNDQQKALSYIKAGFTSKDPENKVYTDSSKGHFVYGAKATLRSSIDIPLGGDTSPALKHPAIKDDQGNTVRKTYYTWSPNFRGNLLFPYDNPTPLSNEANGTGASVKLYGSSDVELDEKGNYIWSSPEGKDAMNHYYGSFVSDRVFALSVQRGNTLNSYEEINPESTNICRNISVIPNSDYLQEQDMGSPPSGSLDTSNSGADPSMSAFMPQFGTDLFSNSIAISDYATIIMDGYQVGFSIGLPLAAGGKELYNKSSGTGGSGTGTGGGTDSGSGSGSGSGTDSGSGSGSGSGTDSGSGSGSGSGTDSGSGSGSGSGTDSGSGSGSGSGNDSGSGSGSGSGTDSGSGSGSGSGTDSGSGSGANTNAPTAEERKNAFQEANSGMSDFIDWFTKPREDKLAAMRGDDYNDAKAKTGAIQSGGLEASLSMAIGILFQYNKLDNTYYFYQATITLTGGLEITLQYRFPVPVFYLYVKFSIGIDVSTGLTVERIAAEGGTPAIIADSENSVASLNTKMSKGKTFVINTNTKAVNVTFSGKVFAEAFDWDTSKNAADCMKERSNKLMAATLSSDGKDFTQIVMKAQEGMGLEPGHKIIIRFTALDDTIFTRMRSVKDVKSLAYFNGIQIHPSLAVEAGLGIGIELFKAEFFVKVSVEFTFAFADPQIDYLKASVKYGPIAMKDFAFNIGIGINITCLFFDYTLDAIGYHVNYDGDSDEWSHGWSALNGAYGEDASLQSAEEVSLVKVGRTSGTESTQRINAHEEPGEVSTFAVTPMDPEAPFQMSGYGSAGEATQLVDGLRTGYTYKAFLVGKNTYIIYHISTGGTQQLVMSQVVLEGTDHGLKHPVDPSSAETYLILDGDGTTDLEFAVSVKGETVNVVWTSERTSKSLASDASDMSDNVVVKFASIDINKESSFTKAQVLSDETKDFYFLPQSVGDVSFAAKTKSSVKVENKNKLYKAYLEAVNPGLNLDPNSPSWNDPDFASVCYQYKLDTDMNALYGDASTIVAYANGIVSLFEDTPAVEIAMPVPDSEIIENLEVTEINGTYYAAYTTVQHAYFDQNGETVIDPALFNETTDRAAIRRLYLRTYTIDGGWAEGKILRTCVDFDQCNSDNAGTQGLKDGEYTGGTCVKQRIDPYFSNLQFLWANYSGSNPETLLLFEMNGNTWLMRENDVVGVANGNTAVIEPFFTVENDSENGAGDGINGTIGSDSSGNLAVVYTSTMPNTNNNAIYAAWWDPALGCWGTGNLLAMNHLQVYEDGIKYKLSNEEMEKAFLGRQTGNDAYDNYLSELNSSSSEEHKKAKGGMDSLTFSDLQMTVYTDEKNDSETLMVFTLGSLAPLVDFKFADTGETTIMPDPRPGAEPDVGFYAIGFGAGSQSLGEASVSLTNYSFITGKKLVGTVSFKNTGTTAIRYGGADAPIKVSLSAVGPNGEVLGNLASWRINQSIGSGTQVRLPFTSNSLSNDFPSGTSLILSVSEDEEYFSQSGGTPFGASATVLTVESKPELQIENFQTKMVGIQDGKALINLDMTISNRGSSEAANVFGQFKYADSNGKKYPIDLTGSDIKVSMQEEIAPSLLSVTENNFSNGVVALIGSDNSQNIKPGYQRKITGTLSVPVNSFQTKDSGLDLSMEVFSDADHMDYINGLYEGDHGEYDSSNNNARKLLTHETFFNCPNAISMSLGNTLYLPVSAINTNEAGTALTAVEMPDGTDSWQPIMGILYYDSDSGCIVAAPAREGSGTIALQDENTNQTYTISFKASGLGEGINIYRDNNAFTFYDSEGVKTNLDAPKSERNWFFSDYVPEAENCWGTKDGTPLSPMNNDLAQAPKEGAQVKFTTVADSITLYFKGAVKVSSSLPNFHEVSGENSPLTVNFGNRRGDKHEICITTDKPSTYLDRYTEKYGSEADPLPHADTAAPHIFWSRSFPDTASLVTNKDSVSLTAYVIDESGIGQVNADFGSSATNLKKLSPSLWQLDITVSENSSYSKPYQIISTDTSGNTSKVKLIVDWFNPTVSLGSNAKVPIISPDSVSFQRSGDNWTLNSTRVAQSGEKASAMLFYQDIDLGTADFTAHLVPDSNGNYPISSNGYYAYRVTDYDGNWSQVILQQNSITTGLPVIRAAVRGRNLVYTVTPASDSDADRILSVKINGKTQTDSTDGPVLSQEYPVYLPGSFTITTVANGSIGGKPVENTLNVTVPYDNVNWNFAELKHTQSGITITLDDDILAKVPNAKNILIAGYDKDGRMLCSSQMNLEKSVTSIIDEAFTDQDIYKFKIFLMDSSARPVYYNTEVLSKNL